MDRLPVSAKVETGSNPYPSSHAWYPHLKPPLTWIGLTCKIRQGGATLLGKTQYTSAVKTYLIILKILCSGANVYPVYIKYTATLLLY